MFRTLSLCVAFCVLLVSGVANAEDKKAHVTAMMEKAVAHYKAVGADQAYKDFLVKDSDYLNGEFYVIVQDTASNDLIFHGANAKLIGKNLMKVKDTDGKQFVAEMAEVAATKGTGWVSYKWPHPATKQIAQKHTYVTAAGDVFFMIGYYE